MSYSEAVDYLLSLSDMERGHQTSSNPTMSLSSVRSLLSRLNDPQLGRGVIHVTGSKGKGSTASMIAGILSRQGLQTALFTSPHLHSFTERIAIGGEAVSPDEFAAGIDAIKPMVLAEQESVHGKVSTFGVLTALFFWLVRAQLQKVDWQVVEVGLGGTFDATNVFDSPDVVVITPISLEHTAILGNTTVEIATDKAGIIKPGSTCVLARQRDPAVVDVIRKRCAEVGAELISVGDSYEVNVLEKHVFGQLFSLRGPQGERELRTPMLGRHQVENAATAVAVADALRARGHEVSEMAIAEGIAHTRLPGRMEVMGQKPFIVGDGAHNGESAAALVQALRDHFEVRRYFVVLGVMGDKDLRSIGFKLADLADLIICCGFHSPRAMDPHAMVQEVGFLGPAAVAEDSVAGAIDVALGHAEAGDLVCITGSLYVVAEAREALLGESVSRP